MWVPDQKLPGDPCPILNNEHSVELVWNSSRWGDQILFLPLRATCSFVPDDPNYKSLLEGWFQSWRPLVRTTAVAGGAKSCGSAMDTRCFRDPVGAMSAFGEDKALPVPELLLPKLQPELQPARASAEAAMSEIAETSRSRCGGAALRSTLSSSFAAEQAATASWGEGGEGPGGSTS